MKHALFVLDLISSRMDLFAERDNRNPSIRRCLFSSVLVCPILFSLTTYVNLTAFPKLRRLRDFLVNLGLNMPPEPPPLTILLLCNPARVILGP